MPATCHIIYDLFSMCLHDMDDKAAQKAVGEMKKTIEMLNVKRQPPLQQLQHVISIFRQVNHVPGVKKILSTAEALQSTKYVMRRVPNMKRNDFYEGQLLMEWHEMELEKTSNTERKTIH